MPIDGKMTWKFKQMTPEEEKKGKKGYFQVKAFNRKLNCTASSKVGTGLPLPVIRGDAFWNCSVWHWCYARRCVWTQRRKSANARKRAIS
jgi:hypothetical protein